jgi:hypothetical protein
MTYMGLIAGFLLSPWISFLVPALAWMVWGIGMEKRWWGPDPGEFVGTGTLILILASWFACAIAAFLRRGVRSS